MYLRALNLTAIERQDVGYEVKIITSNIEKKENTDESGANPSR
jgi:hypothetical protein